MTGYDTKNVDSKYGQDTEEKKEGKGRRGIGTGLARLGAGCGRALPRQEPPAGLAGWPGQGQVGDLRGWRAGWSWPTALKGTEGPTQKVLATSPHF